jgi:hypothetical protein
VSDNHPNKQGAQSRRQPDRTMAEAQALGGKGQGAEGDTSRRQEYFPMLPAGCAG